MAKGDVQDINWMGLRNRAGWGITLRVSHVHCRFRYWISDSGHSLLRSERDGLGIGYHDSKMYSSILCLRPEIEVDTSRAQGI